MTASVRTAPLPLLVVSVLALVLVGSALAFLAWPAHAQSNDPPDEPTGLGASVVSGVGVNLTWNDPADQSITGYEILRRDLAVHDSGELEIIESNTGNSNTAYTDATVEAGHDYRYRIKAINPHGKSVWSRNAAADVPDDYEAPEPEPATDPPARPTGLGASIESGVGVKLTWNDPADATIIGYEILRRDLAVHDSGELETIESDTGSSDTAYTDATVEAGHDYRYRIKAINAHGSSVWSRNAAADVPDDYEAPGSEPDPADLAPTNLTAALVDGDGVSLNWDAPAEKTDSITGYAILRAVGEAELTVLVADTSSTATSYTDATATEKGSTYAYRVKALRDGEESQASNRAEAQIPHDPADLAPTNLTAALVDDGVSLSWEPPAEETDSITGYTILRAVGGEELSVLVADTDSTATAYTDTTATEKGATYAYEVKALRDGEESQASNRAEVKVPHDPADLAPTNLTAQLVDDGGVSLTWDAPVEETASVTGYAILRAVGDGALTTLVADTSGTATAYTDTTATEKGTTYFYQVKALRGEEQSEGSNRAEMLIPHDTADLAPANLTAQLVDGGVSLDWDEPAADAASVTGYQVSRRWSPPDVDNVVLDNLFYADATATTWDDTTLPQAGVSYTYKVRAVRDRVTSEWSNEAQVDVPDDAVVGGSTSTGPSQDPVALPGGATDKPTIDGNPMVGETLTAGTGGIMDDDGITNAVYSYQWVRIDGRNNETDISGATSATYTLVEADWGNRIKVTVSFTDDANNPESRTSDPVGPVGWEEIWAGELTTGEFPNGRVGFRDSFGGLDDRDFTLEGTEYTIDVVALHSGTSLELSLVDGRFGNLKSVLVLEVDGAQFLFAGAPYINVSRSYVWFQDLPSWSVDDTVALRILRMPEPEITLTLEPASLVSTDGLVVAEEVGTVTVGLRAQTAGNVQPSEDFQVVVESGDAPGDEDAETGEDYVAFSKTYVFSAASFQLENGVYVQTVTHDLEITDDDTLEKTERFVLEIDTSALPENVSVPAGEADGLVEITDSDQATINVGPSEAMVEEGEDVELTVTLDPPVGFDLTVSVFFVPDSATGTEDYLATPSEVTFKEGEVSATITITTVEDDLAEMDESFSLLVHHSSPQIDIPNPIVIVTILDDDEPEITLTYEPASLISSSGLRVEEEVGTVAVGLRAETAANIRPRGDFEVVVRSLDEEGSAKAGKDYVSFSKTYTFNAADFELQNGVYVHTVPQDLEITNDEITEQTEALHLEIDTGALPEHVTVPAGKAVGIVEIRDGDVTTVSVESSFGAVEGEDIVVTLRLDKPVPFPFNFGATLTSGTATAEEDFVRSTITPVFNAGDTEFTFRISTVADELDDEDEETFQLFWPRDGLDNDIILPDTTTLTILKYDQPQMTLTYEPAVLVSGDVVQEDDGMVAVGLRAQTAVNVKPTEDFQVVVRSSDVSTEAGLDYVAFSKTYVFSAASFQLENGVYVQTVTHDLDIIDDDITEHTEFVQLDIDTSALPEHVSVPAGQATGSVEIRDDDTTIMSVTAPQAVEEGEDVVVTFMLDKPVPFDASFTVTATAGEAMREVDFEHPFQVITINAGDVEATFSISTVEDDIAENDETFTLVYIRGTLHFAIPLPDNVIVTILDDDEPEITLTYEPASLISSSGLRVEEEVGTVAVGLRAETAANIRPRGDFEVVVRSLDEEGSAKAGKDYVSFSKTYTFNAADFELQNGVYVHTVPQDLEITNDEITEQTEALHLEIDTGALPEHVTVPAGKAVGIVEIRDGDVTTVSVESSFGAVEGEDIVVTLRLDKPVPFPFNFGATLTSGTATAEEDFVRSTITPVFNAGDTEFTFRISTVADELDDEDEETFQLFWPRDGLDNDIILPDTTTLTILKYDQPQMTLTYEPAVLVSGDVVQEDDGMVAVGLRAQTAVNVKPTEDFQVVVRSSDVRAEAGLDYVSFSKTYVFSAASFQLENGVYVQTVTHDLDIIDDDITELSEVFQLDIDTDAPPEHVSVPAGQARGAVEIRNDDVTTVSVSLVEAVEEGEDFVATLTVDRLTSFDFTFRVATSPGTATTGDDFERSFENVTINAGDMEATVRVSTVEDDLAEMDENLTLRFLRLSGLHYQILLPGNVVLTILNDDHAPVVLTPSSLKTPDHSTEIITLEADDGNGDDLTWSITGGVDRGLFNLTGDGALSFRSQQSYDSPGDSNGDRFYRVDLRVTDGDNPVDHQLTIELVHDVSVDKIRQTTAEVTVYALPGNEGETMYLQFGSSHTWSPTQRGTVTDGTAVFRLGGLDSGTRYRVRASLDRKPLRPDDWQRGEFQTEVGLLYGPGSLGAKPTGDGGYRLTWTDPNELLPEGVPELTGYRIVRMDLSGRQPRVTLADNISQTSYTDTGPLVSGQTYFYYVWAVNKHGPSYEGAWARVTPQASDGFTATAPGAPRNLRYDRDAPHGQVALRWDAPEDDTATGYVVTVALDGDTRPDGGYREVELGSAGSTTYTHYLTREDFPDEGYIQRTYRVYAVNDLGLRSWPARVRVPFVGPGCDGCSDSFIRPPP